MRAARVSIAAVCAAALLSAGGTGAVAGAAKQGGNDSAAKRVVALTPFSANALALMGVRPIAVGQTVGGESRLHPKLRDVPVLPLAHPNGPNLEQLASLRPELVFSSNTWRSGHAGMRALGIRVAEREPTRIGAVGSQIKRIGSLVGRKKKAASVAAKINGQVAKARRGIRSKPRVMLILGVGRTPYTFLANSWGGDLLRQAGAELLTGGYTAAGGFARISDEVVVANNPQIIIAVPHANPEDVPELAEYLRNNPAWQSTDAAQNGRVYVSTDNSLVQGGTDVARIIRQVRSQFLQN
jgi:iron complex transport system substrate-binding protein